jgi:hypothetical protein
LPFWSSSGNGAHSSLAWMGCCCCLIADFSHLLLSGALTLSRSSSAMPAHPAPLRKRAPGLAVNSLRSFAFRHPSQPWRDDGFLLLGPLGHRCMCDACSVLR